MKKLLIASMALATMFIIGCGGGAALFNAPQIVNVVMTGTSVTITWEADSTIENDVDFSGYNIYVAVDSTNLLVEDGENLDKFNATVIDTNTYEITPLNQDTVYYIQVRTVNTDDKVGGYNTDVPFIIAKPRPSFTIGKLKLELQTGVTNEDSCALRFATGEILNEENDEFPEADVFGDKIDADSAQIVTASARPNGRSTLVAKLDTIVYSYDDWDFSGFAFGNDDRQGIRANDLLLCKTEEGNYVKVLIDEVNLVDNYIKLTYAYQNIPDLPYLSP